MRMLIRCVLVVVLAVSAAPIAAGNVLFTYALRD